MQTRSTELDSPIGKLRLLARGDTLCALEFVDRRGGGALPKSAQRAAPRTASAATPLLAASHPVVRRLRAYFDGDIKALDDIVVEADGTEFQRRVWQVLRQVKPGAVISYGDLARRAGSPGAARAAGAACGSNPIAVVIPCHRAVGANGSLTGYGGGMERKRWLLRHEAGELKL
ncbi:MAG TPA: methylated-DNA--[protein]-cysteine S-methyltransferase [Candidatus Krumholzibacteria bacterium]|nr:methylated-DNA--[protein]-cysteine S-methyltransferase [Candidatus Krumholzibacteria bacterium]